MTQQTSRAVTQAPPHLSIADLRARLDLSLEEVCEQISTKTELRKPSRGTLSAIESGARGVSVEMLRGLETVYGLREGSLTTTYEPRRRQAVPA